MEKNHTKISLVISDFKMADGNGFDLRERMLESFKEIPFVIVSGFVDKDMAMKGLKFKISNFIEKPYEEDTLRKVIEEESADRIQYLEELIELKSSFLSEANDIIEEIEPVLVSIKRGSAPPQSFDLVFRLIHTLKGSSGVLERPELTSYLHLYEDLIGLLRDGLTSDNDSAVEVLLVAFDKLVEVELIQEEDPRAKFK
ncbi:MAG: response regulator [Bdellovibrionota bacterium]